MKIAKLLFGWRDATCKGANALLNGNLNPCCALTGANGCLQLFPVAFLLSRSDAIALSLGACPVTAQVDTPGRLFQSYADGVSHMSDGSFWTFVRLAAALILATIICANNLRNLRHKMDHGGLSALNWVFVLAIGFLVLALPLPHMSFSPAPRAFIFTVSLLALCVLPGRLAKLLLPLAGHQRVLGTAIYILIALLLTFHFFTS